MNLKKLHSIDGDKILQGQYNNITCNIIERDNNNNIFKFNLTFESNTYKFIRWSYTSFLKYQEVGIPTIEGEYKTNEYKGVKYLFKITKSFKDKALSFMESSIFNTLFKQNEDTDKDIYIYSVIYK